MLPSNGKPLVAEGCADRLKRIPADGRNVRWPALVDSSYFISPHRKFVKVRLTGRSLCQKSTSTTTKLPIITIRQPSIIVRPPNTTNPGRTKRPRITQGWRTVTICMLPSITSMHLRCTWRSTIDSNQAAPRGPVAKHRAFITQAARLAFASSHPGYPLLASVARPACRPRRWRTGENLRQWRCLAGRSMTPFFAFVLSLVIPGRPFVRRRIVRPDARPR